jgi:hypothetical protein
VQLDNSLVTNGTIISSGSRRSPKHAEPDAFGITRRSQSPILAARLSKFRVIEEARASIRSPTKPRARAKVPGISPTLKCGAYAKRPNPPNTRLRRFYEDGLLPLAMEHKCVKNMLQWKEPIQQLNYHRYLPVLVDGLRELEDPYRFMAFQGCMDLLDNDRDNKVAPIYYHQRKLSVTIFC